jgi:hypothetical protein
MNRRATGPMSIKCEVASIGPGRDPCHPLNQDPRVDCLARFEASFATADTVFSDT